MALANARKFDRELNKLIRARTDPIKSTVWPRRGPNPNLTRRKIARTIETLESVVEHEMLRQKHAKDILRQYNYKRQWHPKRGKGVGVQNKRRHFKDWYEKKITTRNCVYAF